MGENLLGDSQYHNNGSLNHHNFRLACKIHLHISIYLSHAHGEVDLMKGGTHQTYIIVPCGSFIVWTILGHYYSSTGSLVYSCNPSNPSPYQTQDVWDSSS